MQELELHTAVLRSFNEVREGMHAYLYKAGQIKQATDHTAALKGGGGYTTTVHGLVWCVVRTAVVAKKGYRTALPSREVQ